MVIIWTGTNWTMTSKEEPTRPWTVNQESPYVQAYNVWGDSRIYATYTKQHYVFSWPSCGASVDLNIRSMLQDGDKVQVKSDLGTYYMVPLPESYTCVISGYGLYSVTCEFAEV